MLCKCFKKDQIPHIITLRCKYFVVCGQQKADGNMQNIRLKN